MHTLNGLLAEAPIDDIHTSRRLLKSSMALSSENLGSQPVQALAAPRPAKLFLAGGIALLLVWAGFTAFGRKSVKQAAVITSIDDVTFTPASQGDFDNATAVLSGIDQVLAASTQETAAASATQGMPGTASAMRRMLAAASAAREVHVTGRSTRAGLTAADRGLQGVRASAASLRRKAGRKASNAIGQAADAPAISGRAAAARTAMVQAAAAPAISGRAAAARAAMDQAAATPASTATTDQAAAAAAAPAPAPALTATTDQAAGSSKITRAYSITTGFKLTCGDKSRMQFTVNGVPCIPSLLMDALEQHQGTPGSLIVLVAKGKCGPFPGPEATFYLRPHTATSNSSDLAVFRDIYLRSAFGFLKRRLATLDVRRIMDLGTNTGLSLLYWALHYPNAQIIGVEPELNNYGIAGLNVAHRPNVFVERASVTDKAGFGVLKALGSGDWAWGTRPTAIIDKAAGFQSVTIPYLMERHKWDTIDYLKIDVEGFELELCQDIAKGAAWIQKVKCLTLEMHDRLRPGLTPTIMDTCHSALDKAGMKFKGRQKVDQLYLWCR